MLWNIALVLIVLWLVGMLAHVGGVFIHLVFIVAVVIIAYEFLKGRREG